jgi:hypothetical protein
MINAFHFSVMRLTLLGIPARSGCLFNLDDLCRTVLSIVKIDRLPKENSVEALLSLQDAWDHVDAYHQYANFYKVMTKMSYALLLLAGVATCVIAIKGGTDCCVKRLASFLHF